MDRLAARWNRKLEAEAVAAEYRAAKPSQVSPHDFPRRPLMMPDESISVLQSNVWRQSDRTGGTAPIAIERAVVSSGDPGPSKLGRTLARPADFVNFAGKLWIDAKQQSANAGVTAEQLKQIATSLDEQQYVPPAKYLESRCARELKAFNSKNSNSKAGGIQTWSRLVTVGDKDHLRGMRRLLSRCAEKLSV